MARLLWIVLEKKMITIQEFKSDIWITEHHNFST